MDVFFFLEVRKKKMKKKRREAHKRSADGGQTKSWRRNRWTAWLYIQPRTRGHRLGSRGEQRKRARGGGYPRFSLSLSGDRPPGERRKRGEETPQHNLSPSRTVEVWLRLVLCSVRGDPRLVMSRIPLFFFFFFFFFSISYLVLIFLIFFNTLHFFLLTPPPFLHFHHQ